VFRLAPEPTQPPIKWVPGILSLAVKEPGREADHSPLSSAEVKNAWSYTSTVRYTFMTWFSVKEKHKCYVADIFTQGMKIYIFLYFVKYLPYRRMI